MKKSIKKLWIDALESGEYVQCRGNLVKRNENGDLFCCLGVLTDLYVRETGDTTVYSNIGITKYKKKFAIGTWLPEVVLKWAGLKSGNPRLGTVEGKPMYATVANDKLRFSFRKIASYLKTNNV